VRYVCLFLFAFTVALPPLLLLYIGTKEPGINLQSALAGDWTLEPFRRLFLGDDGAVERFRESFSRGLIYATLAAAGATVLSIIYATWISAWRRVTAVGFSFTLVTLVLLPQTYLIIPTLFAVQNSTYSLSQGTIIIFLLIIVVIPLCSWIYHIVAGDKIREIHKKCALDGVNIARLMKFVVAETKAELIVVFMFGWAIAWGNYLISFSMGDQGSYTALVQITTFTSNLGRDWAMICAAGFLVALPSILIGSIVGFVLVYRSGRG